MAGTKPSEPRSRAQRVADAGLAVAGALAALEGVLAARVQRGALFVAAPIVVGLLLAAARLRLTPGGRRRVALAVAPALVAIFGVEIALGLRAPRDGTVAARRGWAFDTRSQWEVVRDDRAGGRAAYPSIEPRALLGRGGGGVAIDGATVLPLGGVSQRTIVFCNEGGAYTTYEADERGFNNPPGLWSGGRGAVEVGVVGESFMQGACVPAGAGAVDEIRRAFPATLNLGVSGNGPLVELAGVLEYLADLRPRRVVWAYYDKDLVTMDGEMRSPILRRYLEGGLFKQGLAARQGAIDEALAALAEDEGRDAPAWPGALGAVGLTRARTPMWMQDLVMGEQHSSAGAATRLDLLSGFLSARLARGPAGPPPDPALFERVLARAKAAVGSWGGTLVFVYLADLHNLTGPEHPLRRPVLDVVRRLDLPLVDLQPTFAAVPDPMTLRYHGASHCNEEGYRLIGRTVASALAALP